MKKFLALLVLSFMAGGLLLNSAIAAETNNQSEILQVPLKAVSGGDRNVVVGRQVLFSAAGSSVPEGSEVEYIWNFGDDGRATGSEAVYTYKNPGFYRASLTLQNKLTNEQSVDQFIVSVDKDLIILITDHTISAEEINNLQMISSTQGILIVNIKNETKDLDLAVENELAQKIIESKENIKQAKNIIIWTQGNIGLNAMIDAAQALGATGSPDRTGLVDFGFSNKVIINITNKFASTSRLAQTLFNLVEPQFIVLADQSAINSSVTVINLDSLLRDLKEDDIEYQIIGLHTQREIQQLRPWNFLAYAISYMVNQGVPINTLYLLLVLPVIATILSFSRQFIGFKAFGIYTPAIIALSFLGTGIVYGLIIFGIIIAIASIGRILAKKLRLLYLPRMALILILVSLTIFALLLGGAMIKDAGMLTISIFPILILIVLSEKFVSVQIEKGNKAAIMLTLETLVLSSFCYWIASLQFTKSILLGYPEVIFLCIIVNMILGKWAGIRLVEYIRFRKVIKNVEDAEKK
ncbi:MAG TPA: PKD domain-containing protein [Candidatus Bipolaricaulota bacterium]|nr:PKD domain-containing protein [Candidatus Bipolaricaulota bacterium]